MAQPTASSRAIAEGLFREGRWLLDQGKIGEACRKFEASFNIEGTSGTLLNMALCHEAEGKTATAWAELNQSLARAKEASRADRVKIIAQHIEAIEPRLSRVVLTAAARSPDLVVELDGVRIEGGAFGTAIPIDPGEHAISASAPGKVPWKTQVTVREAARQTIQVPVLPDAPASSLAPQNKPADTAATPSSGAPPEAPPSAPGGHWQAPVGWIAVGIGAVGLGIGTYYGIHAINSARTMNLHCLDNVCDATGLSADSDARSAARIADVSLGIGVLSASAGTVLLILSALSDSAPKSAPTSVGVRLGNKLELSAKPLFGPGVAAGVIGGAF